MYVYACMNVRICMYACYSYMNMHLCVCRMERYRTNTRDTFERNGSGLRNTAPKHNQRSCVSLTFVVIQGQSKVDLRDGKTTLSKLEVYSRGKAYGRPSVLFSGWEDFYPLLQVRPHGTLTGIRLGTVLNHQFYIITCTYSSTGGLRWSSLQKRTVQIRRRVAFTPKDYLSLQIIVGNIIEII